MIYFANRHMYMHAYMDKNIHIVCFHLSAVVSTKSCVISFDEMFVRCMFKVQISVNPNTWKQSQLRGRNGE